MTPQDRRSRRAAHVPVLLDRVRRPARPRAGRARRRRRRRHARPGRAQRGAARAPARRPAWSASTATRRRSSSPAAGWRRFGDRVALVHAVYDELPRGARRLGIARVQGVLFDLGVSSLQLDEADRGFAYARRTRRWTCGWTRPAGITAADVLNTYPAGELARVLREYGEERFARRIAGAVVRERDREPVHDQRAGSSSWSGTPCRPPTRRTGGNPAKRTFQALRIEVNGELDGAASARCRRAVAALAVGGRIAVLSYHSLEDRIVKRDARRRGAQHARRPGCRSSCPSTRRTCGCSPGARSSRPTPRSAANPRAASARLRAAERIRAVGGAGGDARAARGTRREPSTSAPRARRAAPSRRTAAGAEDRAAAAAAAAAAWYARARRGARGPAGLARSLCVTLLAGGLLALLLLNISLSRGSYQLSTPSRPSSTSSPSSARRCRRSSRPPARRSSSPRPPASSGWCRRPTPRSSTAWHPAAARTAKAPAKAQAEGRRRGSGATTPRVEPQAGTRRRDAAAGHGEPPSRKRRPATGKQAAAGRSRSGAEARPSGRQQPPPAAAHRAGPGASSVRRRPP